MLIYRWASYAFCFLALGLETLLWEIPLLTYFFSEWNEHEWMNEWNPAENI